MPQTPDASVCGSQLPAWHVIQSTAGAGFDGVPHAVPAAIIAPGAPHVSWQTSQAAPASPQASSETPDWQAP